MKVPATWLLAAALGLAAAGCGAKKVPASAPDVALVNAAPEPAAAPAPEAPAAAEPPPAAAEVATVPESSGAVAKGDPLEPFVKTADLSKDAALADALATLKNGRPTEGLIAQLKANKANAKQALLKAMWHEEVNVRAQAPSLFAEAGIAGDEEIRAAFQHALRKEPDRDARGMATKALVKLKLPGIAPTLIELLQKDGEGQVRANAAYALGAHDERSATDALVAAMTDPETWVRMRCITALRRIGAKSAVPALEKALGDPNSLVRADAVLALKTLTGKKYAEKPHL